MQRSLAPAYMPAHAVSSLISLVSARSFPPIAGGAYFSHRWTGALTC